MTTTKILIKSIRTLAGETQQQFADRNGIEQYLVSKYETGAVKIGFNKAMEICDRYDFNIVSILTPKSKGLESAFTFMRESIEKNQKQ